MSDNLRSMQIYAKNSLLRVSLILGYLLAASFLFSKEVAANLERHHHIGWRLGVDFPQMREDLLVPVRFAGVGAQLGLAYGYSAGNHQHFITAGFAMAYVKNSYGDPAADLIWDAGYIYMYRLGRGAAVGELWFGGALRYTMDWNYNFSWDQEHLYWLSTLDLGPTVSWQKLFFKKHELRASLEFPIVALASRPPQFRYYKIGRLDDARYHFQKANENMGFTSLHEYISIRLYVDYLYRAKPGLYMGVRYQMGYRTHSEPLRYQRLSQALLFQMRHLFGRGGDR